MSSRTNQPKVYIIIVTYNGMCWIDKCLQSVYSSTYPAEVLVVDNLSTDGTVEFIETNYPKVVLRKQQKNLGFGKANNIGLRHALKNGSDYVLLLNQDAYLEVNTIENLIEAFENQIDNTALISPIHLAPDSTLDFGFEDHIKRYASATSKAAILRQDDGVYEVGFVNAACWMLSKKAIETVGGFNPLFPHYGEDFNYVHRLVYFNFLIKIDITSKVVHDRIQHYQSRSFKKTVEREFVTYLKHLSNINLNLTKCKLVALEKLLKEFAYYLFSLEIKKSLAVLLGYCRLVNCYPEIKKSRKKMLEKAAYLFDKDL